MSTARRYASVSLWVGVFLIAVSLYFFLTAVTLMSLATPAVVAALLSAIIGFVVLSAATSMIRTYVISKVAERAPEPVRT